MAPFFVRMEKGRAEEIVKKISIHLADNPEKAYNKQSF